MKKLWGLMLIMVMVSVLALAGCSSSTSSKETGVSEGLILSFLSVKQV